MLVGALHHESMPRVVFFDGRFPLIFCGQPRARSFITSLRCWFPDVRQQHVPLILLGGVETWFPVYI